MSQTVHIYTAPKEPATRFNVGAPIGKTHWVTRRPLQRLYCWTCQRERIAKNLIAQVYYDSLRFFCMKGKGCNAPNAKSWWCTRHQRNHGPKTRYWSCREGKRSGVAKQVDGDMNKSIPKDEVGL